MLQVVCYVLCTFSGMCGCGRWAEGHTDTIRVATSVSGKTITLMMYNLV